MLLELAEADSEVDVEALARQISDALDVAELSKRAETRAIGQHGETTLALCQYHVVVCTQLLPGVLSCIWACVCSSDGVAAAPGTHWSRPGCPKLRSGSIT